MSEAELGRELLKLRTGTVNWVVVSFNFCLGPRHYGGSVDVKISLMRALCPRHVANGNVINGVLKT